MDKNSARLRRARQTRLKIRELRANRLTVHRSNLHIYASITDALGAKVLVSASSLESLCAASSVALKINGGNIEAAKAVGKALGEAATGKNISAVAFDRGGRLYHGRVKALAEAAREAGLQF